MFLVIKDKPKTYLLSMKSSTANTSSFSAMPLHMSLHTLICSGIAENDQHTFNAFVGGELLGPTFLGSPTLRTVGVGVTFSLLLWKFCWTKIVGPTKDVKVAPTNG